MQARTTAFAALALLATGFAGFAAGKATSQDPRPHVEPAEEAMYGVIDKIVTTPGQRAALIEILLAGTRDLPGCRSYIVAEDEQDPDALWVTEVWENEESHEASLRLPAVQEIIARGKPLIADFGERIVTVPTGGHGLVATSARGEEDEIRRWFEQWTAATEDGDLARARSLVAEDAVFLVPGFGRMDPELFIEGASGSPEKHELYEFSGGSEIEEIRVGGSLAVLWTEAEFAITVKESGERTKYRGHSLSLLEKTPSGSWLLVRDANTVLPLEDQ